MPAGVVGPSAGGGDVRDPRPQRLQLDQRLLQFARAPDDPHEAPVHRLHRGLELVGVLALAREGPQRVRRGALDVLARDRDRAGPLGVLGRVLPGPLAEDQQVRQGVAAQAVRAVHAAGDLARGEQSGHTGGRGVGVDLDAAHDVVAGRPHLHRLGRDVDVGEFLELVVHRRQLLGDVLGVPP